MTNPYKECPTFETENFTLRLVQLADSNDLFACYSDVKAQAFFNADNCTTNFWFETQDTMRECVKSWQKACENEEYIRFAIVDKKQERVVGTIEIFDKDVMTMQKSPVGIFRLDICSEYETYPLLKELFALGVKEFFPLFNLEQMITKVVSTATTRIKAISALNFCAVGQKALWVLDRA